MKRHLFHSLAIPIIGIALALFLTPTASLAATAAGAKISNTASVTWSGAAAPVESLPVVVTVDLLATAPTVAYVSTSPGTTVGAGSAVTITYTVTSTANGADSYTLNLASVESSADLGAPTFAVGNPVNVSLGASMALSDVAASNSVVIPGLAADHGLAAGETVMIGGTPYTINTVVEAGGNTTVTLYNFGTTTDASVTMTAGNPIYEQRELTFDMTTGLFTGGSADETHTLTLTATSVDDNTKSGSVTDPTITVARATLTITKSANPMIAKPGETVTYTIIVTNGGTSSAANVTVTDAPPTFTSYVANSTTLNAVSIGTPDGGTPPLLGGYNIGSLAGGASATITFQVRID